MSITPLSSPRIRRWIVVGIVAGAIGAGGCRSAPTLAGAEDSPRAVARAVVEALNRGDAATLERLTISEDEFRHLVWPKQPAARPGRNIPWDYAWQDLASKSRLQMRGRLRQWAADRHFSVVDVAFTGETTDYETYRIFRASQLTLRDDRGQVVTARLFGSIIEQGGRYKVFSYVVD